MVLESEENDVKNAIITDFFQCQISICSLIATLLHLPQSVLTSSEEFTKRNLSKNQRILTSFETYIIWTIRPTIMT